MTNQNDYYSTNPSQIVAYTTEGCPDCRRAKVFMKRNDIPFLEISVDADNKAAAFVKEQNNGSRSVPTIIFPDGSKMVEPSTGELEEKFSRS